YVDAESAAARVRELLTPQLGAVREDRSGNKLFLTDTLEKIGEIERVLWEIDMPRHPMTLSLSYAKADELAPVLKGLLTPGTGALEVDKRSNQIIVTDIPARTEAIADMVRQLDRQEKEVLIEARINQVGLKDELRKGIDWDAVIKGAEGRKMASDGG
ncbi:MAG: hypothetical protein HQL18_04330, partial [Candidatus Omnitrophica bacterium]|nr:hypothetical protein [Candidatus Omnitrophota bacterium]